MPACTCPQHNCITVASAIIQRCEHACPDSAIGPSCSSRCQMLLAATGCRCCRNPKSCRRHHPSTRPGRKDHSWGVAAASDLQSAACPLPGSCQALALLTCCALRAFAGCSTLACIGKPATHAPHVVCESLLLESGNSQIDACNFESLPAAHVVLGHYHWQLHVCSNRMAAAHSQHAQLPLTVSPAANVRSW